MVVGPGGGRATRPRAPAVRDGPRRARRAVSPGGSARPLFSVYRRQSPPNAQTTYQRGSTRHAGRAGSETVSMPCLVGTVYSPFTVQ